MAATTPKRSKSVLKRARQNKKRHIRNRSVKSTLKTLTKKLSTAITNNKKEEVQTILKDVVSAYDKASSKGIIHTNNAARHISRLTAAVHAFMKQPA